MAGMRRRPLASPALRRRPLFGISLWVRQTTAFGDRTAGFEFEPSFGMVASFLAKQEKRSCRQVNLRRG
ncbi:hypothetical protein CK228_24990 [Mesorhizobium sp. WSM4312]|nr:hypothetical protein CK228_24990 [Mesorhizobium sp. WSM4312]